MTPVTAILLKVMDGRLWGLSLVLLPVVLTACAATHRAPSDGAKWRYAGDSGPAHWAGLDPAYALCGAGRRQSPIDLRGAQRAPASVLRVAYRPAEFRMIDNGHSIEAEAEGDAGAIVLGSTRYRLVRFHFHAPSEHTVAGRSFQMEFHLVHRAIGGQLAVLGVLVEQGPENMPLADLFRDVPAKGEHRDVRLDAADLLPPTRASYRYAGSLTTPPCSEGVRWIVFTEPIELSPVQIVAFTHRYFGTNRPTQPLNGRMLAQTP